MRSNRSRRRTSPPGAVRHPGQRGRLPERVELGPADEVGGDQPVAGERVVAGAVDDPVDQLLEIDRFAVDPARIAARRVRRVRAALDEPGPVGGVLDAVGEDQGLLLLRVEVRRAEQRRQAHRQQGGDGRAEEADAVGLVAGRAAVAARRRPPARAAGSGPAGSTLPAGRRRCRRAPVTQLAGRARRTTPDLRRRPSAARLLGACSSARKRPSPAAWWLRMSRSSTPRPRPGRGQLDAPAGPAAVPAVDGRKGRPVGSAPVRSGGGEATVVAPAVAGEARWRPVDPGQLAYPQMGLDADAGRRPAVARTWLSAATRIA